MKKIILPIAIIILLVIGYIFWANRTVSYVTLDINPSIQINFKRNGKIKNIKALNDDAKELVTTDLKDKTLDDIIATLSERIVENDYTSDGVVTVLVSGTSSNVEETRRALVDNFDRQHIVFDVIVIDNISKEDMALARKYNITPAKAAYIKSMTDENENLDIKQLTSKSVNELREIKNTGNYCEVGYTLSGDRCYKEIGRENATFGSVCPDSYYEYEGKCYYDVGSIETDELECNANLKLTDDNKCVGVDWVDATANFTCQVGELIRRDRVSLPRIREAGNPEEYLCEDRSNAEYPKERCYLQEHAIINGKCAMGPKPLLPTPTGCEGNDINYNGGCYDPNPSEPYVCPDGDRRDDNTELCPDTFTYTKAAGNYSCTDEYTLNGTRCEKERIEESHYKRVCPDGYQMTETGRCISTTNTTEYIDGYRCDKENTSISGTTCIIYEYVDPMHN